jgi:signal transduction histidine kinase
MKTDKDLTVPGLVHDLNNVFQALVDAADVLAGDPRWVHLSAAILRHVERGQRISASLAAVRSAPLVQIVSDAISFVQDATIPGKDPVVNFQLDADPDIELDRAWAWERVFINLFLNARGAMPRGGTVYVRASRAPGKIEISVRDEGSGLAPEVAEKIFEPHVSGTGSSGLGLHIVDTIVRQDGGSVRASNVEGGRGAEFVITLPAGIPPARNGGKHLTGFAGS